MSLRRSAAPVLSRLGGVQTLGNAPLLLHDALTAWQWRPPTSIHQLAEWLEEPAHADEANALVPIEVGSTYMDCERINVPFGAYVHALCGEHDASSDVSSSSSSVRTYLAQSSVFERAPLLAERMGIEMPCNDVRPVWWLGPGGTLSPLHRDPTHNVLVQLCGTKKVTLLPADAPKERLYLAQPPQGNTSLVDPYAADVAERWPSFPKELCTTLTLSPGDALYLPRGTWHQVEAARTTPSFSIALWWGA